jgi:hypothetical protein
MAATTKTLPVSQAVGGDYDGTIFVGALEILVLPTQLCLCRVARQAAACLAPQAVQE